MSNGSTADGRSPATAPQIDADEVIRAAGLLFHPDKTHEIRGLSKGSAPTSRSVRLDNPDGILEAVGEMANHDGTYFTLSGVPEGLGNKAAKDADIVERDNLLIDADVVRPADTNATDEEKARALARIDEVVAFLVGEFQFPAPAIIDSGNGGHAVLRTSLPAADGTKDLVRRFLAVLDKKFGDDQVRIDTKVYNASRVSKLPGTVVRKGPSTPDRPHRVSRVLRAPDELVAVTREQIEAVVVALGGYDDIPVEPERPNGVAAPVTSGVDAYAGRAFEGEIAKLGLACNGERNDQLFKSACNLFELVKAEALSQAAAEQQLNATARRIGLGDHEVNRTLKSAWDRVSPRDLSRVGASRKAAVLTDDEDFVVPDLWPKEDPKMFRGVFKKVVDFLDPYTEADRISTLLQAMIAFGNSLGKGPHFSITCAKHFPNLHGVVVGNTSSARKGTSWSPIKEMFRWIDAQWADECIISGLSTGEGLIKHLNDSADDRTLVIEPEFARVLTAAAGRATRSRRSSARGGTTGTSGCSPGIPRSRPPGNT